MRGTWTPIRTADSCFSGLGIYRGARRKMEQLSHPGTAHTADRTISRMQGRRPFTVELVGGLKVAPQRK